MAKLVDKLDTGAAAEASANSVAEALSLGSPRRLTLTPEQTAAFCALKANAEPPTETLRRAAAKPRRFQRASR